MVRPMFGPLNRIHPMLGEIAKSLIAIVIAGGIAWIAMAFQREEPHRGRRSDSVNAFHEFLESHREMTALFDGYTKTPPQGAAEKQAVLDRCRGIVGQLDPKVYGECDKRLARAIAGYKKVRTEQLDLATAALPAAPDAKAATEAQNKVDTLRPQHAQHPRLDRPHA